jgi:site-specific DNA-methyltransferase (cytosine-N4-specific)
MSDKFNKDNGGAIPSNLLQIPNSESNGSYLKYCKALGLKGHPARFPITLPEFYINFLTDPNDLVVDIFAGSNTTGFAAEQLGRRWVTIELSPKYMATSVLRFSETEEQAKERFDLLMRGESVSI